MKADIKVIYLHAKEPQRWLANHQKIERLDQESPSQCSGGSYPAGTLISTASFQNCCSNPPVFGTLFMAGLRKLTHRPSQPGLPLQSSSWCPRLISASLDHFTCAPTSSLTSLHTLSCQSMPFGTVSRQGYPCHFAWGNSYGGLAGTLQEGEHFWGSHSPAAPQCPQWTSALEALKPLAYQSLTQGLTISCL